MPAAPTPHTLIRHGGATHRFFLGDCLEILPALESASIQTIITSPPYNFGVEYRSFDDRLPRAEYLAWTSNWVQAVAQVLDPKGSPFLNVGGKPTDPWTALDVGSGGKGASRHLSSAPAGVLPAAARALTHPRGCRSLSRARQHGRCVLRDWGSASWGWSSTRAS